MRVAAVTGATGALGSALARALAQAGFGLGLCGRNQGKLEALSRELKLQGCRVLHQTVDLTSERQVRLWCANLLGEFGQVDALVNNAARGQVPKFLHETTFQDWKNILETNLGGAFLTSKFFVPSMRQRGKGSIIHVSSGLSRLSEGNLGAYACSKAALNHLTRVQASELSVYGISVNGVDPGSFCSALNPEADPARVDLAVRDVIRLCHPPQEGKMVTGRFFRDGLDLGW